MSVKQISVFIENQPGKLAEATRYIASHGINLRAMSIADTKDFGILRVICDDPEQSAATLREGGYITNVTEVLAVGINDAPGSLATILEIIAQAGVSVEYTYAFLGTRMAGAFMIFRVDDNAKAAAALEAAGIKTVEQSDMF